MSAERGIMTYRIVSDSSSDILKKDDPNYRSVPLHILFGGQDWPDTADTDLDAFDAALDANTGSSSTSCPSPHEWYEAFGDADVVYCFTITHTLSGSFNSAMSAKHQYEEEHPDRKVYVCDSYATGGRMVLMMDYLTELLEKGTDFEEAYTSVMRYRDQTELMFTLQSMKMLAANGRVPQLLAKAAGILDMRLVGRASEEGKLTLIDRHRGARRVLLGTFKQMLSYGYNGGRVVISHNRNLEDANGLAKLIREKFGDRLAPGIMKENEDDVLGTFDPQNIVDHWPEIVDLINQIPSVEELEGLYKAIGSKYLPEHIGIDPALRDEMLPISAAIRNRLTLVRMMRVLKFPE